MEDFTSLQAAIMRLGMRMANGEIEPEACLRRVFRRMADAHDLPEATTGRLAVVVNARVAQWERDNGAATAGTVLLFINGVVAGLNAAAGEVAKAGEVVRQLAY